MATAAAAAAAAVVARNTNATTQSKIVAGIVSACYCADINCSGCIAEPAVFGWGEDMT